MKLHHATALIFGAGLLSSSVSRAVPGPAQDWATLKGLTTPSPAPAGKKTAAERQAELAQKAATARQAATAAKAFYTAYATDVHASEARKIEAVQSLLGASDDAQKNAAQQTAAKYRADKANTLTDRFDVAVLAERVNSAARLGGSPLGNVPSELEAIGAKLRAEFGDVAEVFNFYASVARCADMASAKRIATNILAWPAGPAARAEAQSILKRDGLLQRPLDVRLKNIDGSTVDLASRKGKVTVVFAWAARNGSSDGLAALLRVKSSLPPNAEIVYLGVGGSATEVAASKSRAPISGVWTCEPGGPLAAAVSPLQLRHLPYAFVIGPSGTVSGFGPAGELPNLIVASR